MYISTYLFIYLFAGEYDDVCLHPGLLVERHDGHAGVVGQVKPDHHQYHHHDQSRSLS